MTSTDDSKARDDELMVVNSQQIATAVLEYGIRSLDWPNGLSAKVRCSSVGINEDGDALVAAYLSPIHTLDSLLDIEDSHVLAMQPESEPEQQVALSVQRCDAVLATMCEELNLYELDYIAAQICATLDDAEKNDAD